MMDGNDRSHDHPADNLMSAFGGGLRDVNYVELCLRRDTL